MICDYRFVMSVRLDFFLQQQDTTKGKIRKKSQNVLDIPSILEHNYGSAQIVWSEFGIRNSGFGIRNSEFGIRDSGFGIRDSGFETKGFGIRGSRRRGSGFETKGY